MSDTPRTDAARQDENDPYMAVASECSKLERELNAANQIIRQQQLLEGENLRLTAKVAQLYAGAEEQKQRIKRLDEENLRMLDYIKRLEGAGDYIVEENDIHIGKEVWRKAKEAKL